MGIYYSSLDNHTQFGAKLPNNVWFSNLNTKIGQKKNKNTLVYIYGPRKAMTDMGQSENLHNPTEK